MQKIIPNLWFNRNADEAIDFYMTIFRDGKILRKEKYPEQGLMDFQKEFSGKTLTIEFEIMGMKFIAINAGDEFKFTEAISLMINCKDQVEIDYYWEKLSSGSEFEQCGWCKDKYGLSWQIVPENMGELLRRPNAFAHMLEMKKLIIEKF